MDDVIRELVAHRHRERVDAIERMCERMLVTPGPLGVLVTDGPDGAFRVELSPDVTPMKITERRVYSRAAWDGA